jgi:phage tail-like protein
MPAGTPSFNETTKFGMSMRFDVVVGGVDLGGWSSCEGLSVDYGLTEIKAGGNNDFSVFAPGRLKYVPLVLKRAMSATDSNKLMGWLRSMVGATEGDAATITLKDSHNGVVASWTFANARPSAWKGPSLSAAGKEVAIETLQLVHEGFLT